MASRQLWSNAEAFSRLEEALREGAGTDMTHADIFKDSTDGTVVGRGLDREGEVRTEYDGRDMVGLVAVRAVLVRLGGPGFGKGVKWFIRTRLWHDVPEGVEGVEPGRHEAVAAYQLRAEDPHLIDKVWALINPYRQQVDAHYDALEAGAGDVPPLPDGEQPEPPRIYRSLYSHITPSGAVLTPTTTDPNYAENRNRWKVARAFQHDGPGGDPTSMLSPDVHGIVNETELPRTIGWLLASR